MKKLSLILAVAILLSISACNDNKETTNQDNENQETTQDTDTSGTVSESSEVNFATVEHGNISFEVPEFYEISEGGSALRNISYKSDRHETSIRIFYHDSGSSPSNVGQTLEQWKRTTPNQDKFEIINVIDMFGTKVLFTREVQQHFNHEERTDEFKFHVDSMIYMITVKYGVPDDMDSESIIEHFLYSIKLKEI